MSGAAAPRMVGQAAPRLLSRAELRRYLGGVAWRLVVERMNGGKLPKPLWNLPADDGNARWDRRSVDRALDRESGIPGSLEQQVTDLDAALGLR